MNLALQFALDNRLAMIDAAVSAIEKVLGTKTNRVFFVNRNHNYAEMVEEGFVIHRKGATHAEDGMYGVKY